MTDQNKFEEMLERLINEDRSGAEELFHEIVVAKSREIYQDIIESEEEVDEDEEVDESSEDDLDEMFGLDEVDDDMGGDPTDDMMSDIEDGDDMDDMGDDIGDDEEIEDRVVDLEDALAELQQEFEAMMGDDDDMGDDDMDSDDDMDDMDDMGDDDMDDDDMDGDDETEESYAFEESDEEVDESEEEVDEVAKSATEQMREYVEKISAPSGGDNGANSKSIVAKPNNMGGTSANIAKGATEAGGKAAAPKVDDAGNRNKPGGMSAKKGMKNEPGHGAEKKGKPENAADKKSLT